MALLGNVVVRRPGEPEVYAETADLHERFSPGNPDWGHPPLEGEVRATERAGDWSTTPAACSAPRSCAGTRPFSGSTGTASPISCARSRCTGGSISDVREPLLDAIAERIRTRMGDRAPRRYLSVLRVGQRTG